jgi:hypothetical protein
VAVNSPHPPDPIQPDPIQPSQQPEPFLLGQLGAAPPKKSRRGLIIAAAVAAAVVVAGVTAAATVALTSNSGKPTAAPSSTWKPLYADGVPASNAAPNTAAPAPSPTTKGPAIAPGQPGSPWTPCPDLCPDSASDYNADSCTASQYSEQWGNNGLDGVIEAMIENKWAVNPDRLKDCPKYLAAWDKAKDGFYDGTHAVPGEVKPGTYETLSGVNNCYWERARGGQTIDNRFITGSSVKIRVTIRSGDDTFITRGCDGWVKVG